MNLNINLKGNIMKNMLEKKTFEYRQLNKSDIAQLEELIAIIENGLPDKAWWVPIDDVARQHFFDEDWTYFIGAFDGDKLAGACGLFLNPHEFEEEAEKLNLDISKTKIAEIGRCMVNPEYRGNNLMCEINSRLRDVARDKGIDTVLAVAHPENTFSNNSFKKLGAIFQLETVVYNTYSRNIYTIPLS